MLNRNYRIMRNIRRLLNISEYTPLIQPVLDDFFYTKYLTVLKEKKIDLDKDELRCDKIFCSEWLSDEVIVFATKDQKVFLFNSTNKKISLIKKYELEPNRETGGIKTMHINPYTNYLALSSNSKIQVFNDIPREYKVLSGHTNWISNIEWISHNNLITSSKDESVRLWNVEENSNKKIYKYDNNYCRDFERNENKLMCLSPNGIIKFIDINKQKQSRELQNNEREQCVVVKYNKEKNLLSIGSSNGINFLDCRQRKFVLNVSTEGNGIRSIEWYNNNILSFGTGNNQLSFFDMRYNELLKIGENKEKSYKINIGYIKRNESLINLEYNIDDIESLFDFSIFTHKYNPMKNKIFVGGGSTFCEIFGSNISILE